MINNEEKSRPAAHEVWVIIPTYNEADVIGDVLDDLVKTGYSILVVDDCSTDNSVSIALTYPVTLLRHSINLGQGAALQTGFDYVIAQSEAKYVITFDSDGQHDSLDIPNLLKPLISGKHDVSLGSRFLNPSKTQHVPWNRWVILKFGIIFSRIITRLKLTDTHNGLRGFTIEALRLVTITQNRMAHASEILAHIAKNQLRWIEVPVTIRYTHYSRKKGQSGLNAINILWDLIWGKD